jgi:GMC oxidoreductase
LRHEIEGLDNLEIWLGATVARFEADPASGKVTSLRATNHGGQILNVAASQYLIAGGALESTRLLLLADRQLNRPISRDGGVLGRYFNDHLGLKVATLRPIDWGATNRALSDRSPFSGVRHLHFELRPEVQQAHGIGSAYFDIGTVFPTFSAVPKVRAILNSIRSGTPQLSFSDLRSVVQDLPSFFWHVQWQLMRKQRYWPLHTDLQVMVWVEQLPCWRNRICLSDQVDSLQIPKLRLEWTKTDAEEKTFRIMVEKIGSYWRRHLAKVCELQWNLLISKPDSRLADAAEDLAHPAGSTRMGTTSSNSVVDSNMVVHRLPNLSVVSSSVFPTSGSANPTLTVMQLAMRAADALAGRLAF